jgi:hypothetical protein
MKAIRNLVLVISVAFLCGDALLFWGLLDTSLEYTSTGSITEYSQLGSFTTLTSQGCTAITAFIFFSAIVSVCALFWLYATRRRTLPVTF